MEIDQEAEDVIFPQDQICKKTPERNCPTNVVIAVSGGEKEV
jgi:hypothetical protein